MILRTLSKYAQAEQGKSFPLVHYKSQIIQPSAPGLIFFRGKERPGVEVADRFLMKKRNTGS